MPRLDSSTARRTGCLHARRPASMVAAVAGSSMIGGTTRLCGWGDRSGTRASPLLPRLFLRVHAHYVARVPPSAPLRPQATGADGWIRRCRCRARCHHDLPLSRSVRRRYVRLQNGCTLPCVQPSSYGSSSSPCGFAGGEARDSLPGDCGSPASRSGGAAHRQKLDRRVRAV